jgi:ferritin
VIPAIPAPRPAFSSAEDAVGLSLESELRVTKQINEIMALAMRENDFMSRNMLEWFISEQREEVSSMDTLLRMVKRAGQSGLLFVEQYLMQGGAVSEEAADDGD